MTKRNSKRLARCVNETAKCINDITAGPIWDRAGWEATISDIDRHIADKRAAIKKLLHARKIALRNYEQFKEYPWSQMRENAFAVKDDPKSRQIHERNIIRIKELREAPSTAR